MRPSAMSSDERNHRNSCRRAFHRMLNADREAEIAERSRVLQLSLNQRLTSNDERPSTLLNSRLPNATFSVDSPFDTNSITSSPQPSTLQILQMAITGNSMTRPELFNAARSIGNMEMVPEFVEELRRSFTGRKEIALLEELLSAKNFKAFRGEETEGMEVDSAGGQSDYLFDANQQMTDILDWESQAAFTDLAPGDVHASLSALSTQVRIPAANSPFPIQVSTKALNPGVTLTKAADRLLSSGQMALSSIFPLPSGPKFEYFMALPIELHERIYNDVLSTGAPILPHLCDHVSHGALKFHDSTQHSRLRPHHGAITALLGVTFVSKQIRAESLPCFYATNTFAVGNDTATYFAHLQYLGRFTMLRSVRFNIPMYKETRAARTLQLMRLYRADTTAFEAAHPRPKHLHADVTAHPRYISGGQSDLTTFICLSMLAAPTQSGAHVSRLVLPVPSAAIFAAYPRLRWFPAVCSGLGMALRFTEGHAVGGSWEGGVAVTWHRKYQGFVSEGEDVDVGEGVDVKRRVEEMFPGIDTKGLERWRGYGYMRASCDGERYRWFNCRD